MDINKLTTLVAEGYFYEDIAKQLDCNITTVKRWTKKLNLTVKTKITRSKDQYILNKIKSLHDKGMTVNEISDIIKISKTTIRKYLKNFLNVIPNSSKKYLREFSISKEQLEIIYGSMLGDMSMSLSKNLARFVIGQGGNHESYFDHLFNKFENLMGKPLKKVVFDKRTKKCYNKFSCKSLSHKFYNDLYNLFYKNNKKTVTKEWLDHLTIRGVAYWFMDDGDRNGVFATNSFSYNEIELLQKWFIENLNIKTRIKKVSNADQYLLIISKESLKYFNELIKPFIINDMHYKLKY